MSSTAQAAPPRVEPASEEVCDRPARPGRSVVLACAGAPLAALVCATLLNAPLWWSERGWFALLAGVSKPLDLLLMSLVLALSWCLTGRYWLSVGLLVGVSAGLAVVDAARIDYLSEPVMPTDYQFLTTPGFLVAMLSPLEVVGASLAIAALGGATLSLSRWARTHHPRVHRARQPTAWLVTTATRVVGAAVLIAVLAPVVHFNEPGNPWRRVYDATGAVWQPFSQTMNYRTNGFLGGVLYNMPSDPMARPSDYSASTMTDLATRYAAVADERNAGRTTGALADVNVVLVLSEAFADLSRLNGVRVAEDPMPAIRDTIATTWGGTALANFYGTGTSSMEFSALTGQSLGLFNPQVSSPYQNFMGRLDSYPSAVGWFTAQGHVPVAVHPYNGSMYRRSSIYPMLGFADFVDRDSIRERGRIEDNGYISDASAFDEVTRQVAEHDDPLFVNLVTMQNHVPTAGKYADPIAVDAPGEDAGNGLGAYARGQAYTDHAVADFLADLEGSGESTVVVFYGDHYPGVLPDEVLAANAGTDRLETPLFIWSSGGQSPRALPVTAPGTFLPLVFDLVGEPLPPYYALLDEVAQEVGAVGRGVIVRPDGSEVTESELTDDQQRLLHDYRLVQYDFSVGERYAVDEMFYPMGAR